MTSTAENLLLWEQRIKEKVQSQMTIEEWCKTNGVSKHQYNYWNGRVRKEQRLGEQTPFAEITPILQNNNPGVKNSVRSIDFQIIIRDIRVVVPTDFHPETLAGLVKVLRTV